MAQDYTDQYERARQRVKELRDQYGNPDDAENILRMADAYDEDNLLEECPDGQRTKSVTTLKNYLTGLTKVAREIPLTTATTREYNQVFQSFFDGTAEAVKDDGLAKGSLRVYQNGCRQFLYWADAEADPEGVALFKPEQNKVDPEDMLTREEIHACRNACDSMRDLAFFDFLLYTGQRNTAARTIRIQDLDLENNRFKLNENADGLKAAEENGKWRDLLLSEATIRQYLDTEHPAPDDPDAYVFVARGKYNKTDPYSTLKNDNLSKIIKKIGDKAAEENPSIASKPVYPHALRHNFVTIALQRGMPESTIKHQIGHKPESNVMETTYAHLSDSDHIQKARNAFDLETDAQDNPAAPESCPRCGAPQDPAASLCGVCHLEFTMDAKEASEEIDERLHEGKGEAAASEDEAIEDGVDAARHILNNNPEAKATVMEELKDEVLAEVRDELDGETNTESAAPAAADD